jgi:FkbM family methyltransferase
MNLWERVRRRWEQGDLGEAVVRAGSRKLLRFGRKVRKADAYYWLDPERVLTARYAATLPGISETHRQYGNYWLDSRLPLTEDSIVYSFGVGGDVDFDRAVAQTHGCRVQLYDPTPVSIEFMQQVKADKNDPVAALLDFHPYGAWVTDIVLRFEIPGRGGSASIHPQGGLLARTFEAPCLSVKSMLRENKHDHIDVLKMDIEGAAEAVMDHLLAERILPSQIVGEFERPVGDVKKVISYFSHIDRLCERLMREGYEVCLLPRDKGRYFGLELLFSRVNRAETS